MLSLAWQEIINAMIDNSEIQPPYQVDASAHSTWNDHGFILLDNLLSESISENLTNWVDEIANLPNGKGTLKHYWEQTGEGPKLCRTEQFLDSHDDLQALITDGPVQKAASQILGEEALIYKEKLNYKLPGGSGFSAHQDAPAYPLIKKHVTCLIAIDDMTIENGCLEFAFDNPDGLLEQDEKGCIRKDIVEELQWKAFEVPRNMCLFFSSYTPHRSAQNNSIFPRRALYLTYNGCSDGDARVEYYAQRNSYLSNASDGSTQKISLISDFQGKIIF